jgi:hypothetical protein
MAPREVAAGEAVAVEVADEEGGGGGGGGGVAGDASGACTPGGEGLLPPLPPPPPTPGRRRRRLVVITPPPPPAEGKAKAKAASAQEASPTPPPPRRAYAFPAALGPETTNEGLWAAAGVPRLLDAALAGYHATILAYGQTGGGKTHTMAGTGGSAAEGGEDGGGGPSPPSSTFPPGAGLIPRAVSHLFARAAAAGAADGLAYTLRASCAELYNEQLYDLLAPPARDGSGRPPLAVRWDAGAGFHAPDQTSVACATAADAAAVLAAGLAARRTAGHALNGASSRSHALFTLTCEGVPRSGSGGGGGSGSGGSGGSTPLPTPTPATATSATPPPVRRFGRVTFVDLAGSERARDSGSVGGMLREAGAINRSLFVLGQCVAALAAGGGGSGGGGGGGGHGGGGGLGSAHVPPSTATTTTSPPSSPYRHIPYRDSKLTKLLMDALGGGGLALLIACVSPASGAVDETLATLAFAARAARVRSAPAPHVDAAAAAAAAARREVLLLRAENAYLRGALAAATGGRGGVGVGGGAGSGPAGGSAAPGSALASGAATPLLLALPGRASADPVVVATSSSTSSSTNTATAHLSATTLHRRLAADLAAARALAARFAADNAALAAEARALRARRAAVDADYRGALDELDALRARLDALEGKAAGGGGGSGGGQPARAPTPSSAAALLPGPPRASPQLPWAVPPVRRVTAPEPGGGGV